MRDMCFAGKVLNEIKVLKVRTDGFILTEIDVKEEPQQAQRFIHRPTPRPIPKPIAAR